MNFTLSCLGGKLPLPPLPIWNPEMVYCGNFMCCSVFLQWPCMTVWGFRVIAHLVSGLWAAWGHGYGYIMYAILYVGCLWYGMCMYKAMGRPWAGLHVSCPGGVAPALLPTPFLFHTVSVWKPAYYSWVYVWVCCQPTCSLLIWEWKVLQYQGARNLSESHTPQDGISLGILESLLFFCLN